MESRGELAAILESIGDGFAVLDSDCRLTYVNQAVEQLLQKSRQDILGKFYWEVLPVNEASVLYKGLMQAMRERTVVCAEEYYAPLDCWIEARYYPSRKGLSIFCKNITQRKEEERLLREREQEFKTLVENSPDIIARVDKELRFLYINPAIARISGKPAQEYIGKTPQESDVPEAVYTNRKSYISEAFATGENLMFEEKIPTLEGWRDFLCFVAPEFGADGSVESVLTVDRDVTEKRRLENEIARLDRLDIVGKVAANIGHEIRNPMTTVRGFLQLLRGKADCRQYQASFDLMIEELDRANSIISEFLSLAKNKSVDLKPRSLNEIVCAILPLLQADAVARNKEVKADLGVVSDVWADAREIRQLLLNLVRNGLEADGSSRVSIVTCTDGNAVVLTVQDDGEGIPEEIMEQLGAPFVTTKETGTGLGLPVCYSIAARHNATLAVKTSAYGTVFEIRFEACTNDQDKKGIL